MALMGSLEMLSCHSVLNIVTNYNLVARCLFELLKDVISTAMYYMLNEHVDVCRQRVLHSVTKLSKSVGSDYKLRQSSAAQQLGW